MNITLKIAGNGDSGMLKFEIFRGSILLDPVESADFEANTQLSSGSSLIKVNLKSLKQPSFGLRANLEVKIFSCF